jgi:hypothetical protein
MGSRATARKLRVMQLLAASLTMLLATVPALATQSPDEVSEDLTPVGQDKPALGESPVESPTGPPGGVPGICAHAPGALLESSL